MAFDFRLVLMYIPIHPLTGPLSRSNTACTVSLPLFSHAAGACPSPPPPRPSLPPKPPSPPVPPLPPFPPYPSLTAINPSFGASGGKIGGFIFLSTDGESHLPYLPPATKLTANPSCSNLQMLITMATARCRRPLQANPQIAEASTRMSFTTPLTLPPSRDL